ncbi:MAG: hypothetical protein MZV70_56745 [Desulfobacterales bacterium]|nr:hypothetical protein [Desulfobacterales bacterium]
MALVLQSVDKIVGREVHLKDVQLEFAPGSRHVILGRTLAGQDVVVADHGRPGSAEPRPHSRR